MFKLTNILAALLTAAAIFAAPFGTITYAEDGSTEAQTEKVTADDIAKDSVIYYFNMNRLLDKGEMKIVDPSDNLGQITGGTAYAELGTLEEYFGITYKWDGSTSSLILTDGDYTCSVECGDVTDITEDKGFFLGEYSYIPLKAMCEKIGWGFYHGNDFWAVSKNIALDTAVDKTTASELLDMGKTMIAEYDFETEKPDLKMGLWNGASAGTFAMPCGIVTEDGNSFVQIGASTSGYGGLYLPPVQFEKDTVIQIDFDAKKSDDFDGSSITFLIQGFKNGVFSTYIDGIYTTPAAGEWMHMQKIIKSSDIPADITDIRFAMCTTNKTTGKPAGRLMFDNFKIRSYPVFVDNEVTPDIKADKLGNWYILGETITMTPQNKLDMEQYKNVIIEIYDSWNNVVHKETISAEVFNSGYKWTPDKQGFYEYQFYTTDIYGRTNELNDFYTGTNPNTKEKVKVYLKRQGVVVARYKTKPMEERSDRLAVSIEAGRYMNPEIANGRKNGLQGDQIALADLLGFSTIRLHWLSPDGLAYKTESKANVKRGVFDFAEWDLSVNDARERGFNLILNLLGTPRYAVPYRTGYVTSTGKGINYYAPVNINAWRAYVDYAVNRYKDVCHIWEIWNEPHVYGGSVFWQGITEDFAEIQKAGYEAVKKYQPGDESIVLLGGIGARRYTNFYEELVQTDAYDAYDMLAMHGWDVDPWTYNKIAEDYGKEPKPICSTELHMMLRASDSEYLNNTEKEEAMRCITEFLKDFKYGSKFTTFFAVNVQSNIEWLKYLNEQKIYGQGMDGGAFKVAVTQPRFAAIAMNTFFDTMGKQYDYVDEYLLANKKQNVVRVNSNGQDQLIVWNVGGSKSNTTLLSKQITDCAGEDFRIIDWENNDVDVSDLEHIEIKPETMYFISGLDGEKLNSIESAQGEELYTGKVLFNITEKAKTDTGNIINHVVANGSTKPLFDKSTFAVEDGIEYVGTNWKWISAADGAERGDFDAKHALSVTDDGMYLIVRVTDSSDNPGAAQPSEMNLYDSVQFAFDTVGDRSTNGYQECYVGIDSKGRPTVFKKTAPYIGGDIISDFTPGDSVIEKAAVQRRADGNEVTYMVYLPNSEIYPYERNINEAIHFAIAVNQNNGGGNIGCLEWGGGIAKEKNPLKFGDVWLDSEIAAKNDVYYPPLGIGNNKPLFDLNTLEYNEGINWINDNINWVSLTGDNDETFKAKFAVGMTDEGMYIAAEVDDDDIDMDAKGSGSMWSKDSMQFAIDMSARGNTDDRIEIPFGRVAGQGDTLYKESAPFITATKVLDGYTQSKNVIENGVHSITAGDGKIIYKMFIPAAEIYPFDIAENDVIKMSFLFNQCKGGTRIGYLEWSSGIGATKNSRQYGIISYK